MVTAIWTKGAWEIGLVLRYDQICMAPSWPRLPTKNIELLSYACYVPTGWTTVNRTPCLHRPIPPHVLNTTRTTTKHPS